MRLTVLGSSGSFPGPGNPSSSYLVTHADTSVLLDIGPGSFMRLLDVMEPADLTAVFVSHVHADHCTDIFALYGHLVRRWSEPVSKPVFVPPGVAEPMAAFMRAGPEHPFHIVCRFEEIEDGFTTALDGMQFRVALTDHPVPTLAVRVEADGSSLTYSADTGLTGGLAELTLGTDVLFCGAGMSPPRDPDGFPFHLTAGEA
ncbi:MAG: MBL fold metallo-hydrolase, partial [Acidimicrobiia bacterium]